MAFKTKSCEYCGVKFVPTGAHTKCCVDCRRLKQRLRDEDRSRKRREARNAAPKPKISLAEAARLCEKYGKTYGQLQKEGLI